MEVQRRELRVDHDAPDDRTTGLHPHPPTPASRRLLVRRMGCCCDSLLGLAMSGGLKYLSRLRTDSARSHNTHAGWGRRINTFNGGRPWTTLASVSKVNFDSNVPKPVGCEMSVVP